MAAFGADVFSSREGGLLNKHPQFEFWRLYKTGQSTALVFTNPDKAFRYTRCCMSTQHRRMRVRTFYDRKLQRRVVQFLLGNGWAIRGEGENPCSRPY